MFHVKHLPCRDNRGRYRPLLSSLLTPLQHALASLFTPRYGENARSLIERPPVRPTAPQTVS